MTTSGATLARRGLQVQVEGSKVEVEGGGSKGKMGREEVWAWVRLVAVVVVPLLLLPLPLYLNTTPGEAVEVGEVGRTGKEWSAAYVVLLMGVYWSVTGRHIGSLW